MLWLSSFTGRSSHHTSHDNETENSETVFTIMKWRIFFKNFKLILIALLLAVILLTFFYNGKETRIRKDRSEQGSSSKRVKRYEKLDASAKNTLYGFCGNQLYNKELLNFQLRDHLTHFENIHLFVTLNSPLWKVIPLVDSLYRPFFSRITYCGDSAGASTVDLYLQQGYDIIMYDVPKAPDLGPGWVSQKCWIKFLGSDRVTPDLVGVMSVHDDQIIDPREAVKLNTDVIWRTRLEDQVFDMETESSCINGVCGKPNNWKTFNVWGKLHIPRYNGAFKELKQRAGKGEQPFKDCYSNLIGATGRERRFVGGHPVDMYYVPRRYLQDYRTLLELFWKHVVFVEVAVNTAQVCLEKPKESEELYGLNIWSSDRHQEPWIGFQKFQNNETYKLFHHPVKWTPLLDNKIPEVVKKYTKFLCETVLPFLHPKESPRESDSLQNNKLKDTLRSRKT